MKLAHQENFRSVEHLKRYTTLGMATDQGTDINIAGLSIMAELAGKTIQETGTTIYRPPYTPTPIGAFAGRSRDEISGRASDTIAQMGQSNRALSLLKLVHGCGHSGIRVKAKPSGGNPLIVKSWPRASRLACVT